MADRSQGLGSSDSAAAIGLSKWKTPYKLWREKVFNEEPDLSELLHIQIGNALEPLIINRFEQARGLTVGDRQARVVDHERPWRWATLDGIASDGGLVEAKSVGFADPAEWGDEETDTIPMSYFVQVQHGLSCSDLSFAWVPVVTLNRSERVYRVERDDEFISMMIERETEFWDCVLERREPEIKTLEDCALAWPIDVGTHIEATPEILQDVVQLATAKAQIKEATEIEKTMKLRIATFMQDASTLTSAGNSVLTYKSQNRKGYTVEPSSFRVMRLSK